MERSTFNKLLEALTVPCFSNQHGFINTKRIQRIEHQLVGSQYHMILRGKLFDLYGKTDWETLIKGSDELLVISTHIDCARTIRNFWAKHEPDQKLYKGTFDNAVTNAAVLKLMLEDQFPDHVLVAFTGEEESSLMGARELAKVFKETRGAGGISVMTLDVTFDGYDQGCSFAIENAFDRFDEHFYHKLFTLAEQTGRSYLIVPPYAREKQSEEYQEIEQMDRILMELGLMDKLTEHAADGDESIEYHLEGMECFSFCLPSKGEMHDVSGLTIKEASLEGYIEALNFFAKNW